MLKVSSLLCALNPVPAHVLLGDAIDSAVTSLQGTEACVWSELARDLRDRQEGR